MAKTYLTEKLAAQYTRHLYAEEKGAAAIEKHLRDIRRFGCWLDGRNITKELVNT